MAEVILAIKTKVESSSEELSDIKTNLIDYLNDSLLSLNIFNESDLHTYSSHLK